MNPKTHQAQRGPRRRAALSLIGAALAASLLAACGSSPQTAVDPTPASGGMKAAVTIHVFQFMPSPVTVKAGTAVTWTNQDAIFHTVTSGTPGAPESTFDLTLDGQGTTGTFTFTKPGTYRYFCQRHNVMRGEIRVT